jgi:hypothetical protein
MADYSELMNLEKKKKEPASPTPVVVQPPKQTTPINEQTNEVSNKRTNERSKDRKKIRHTFDIYADQLLALREITLKREIASGERHLLGELVQEALDRFITKERRKEETNV